MAKNQLNDGKMVLNIGKLRNFVVNLRNSQLPDSQEIKKLLDSTFFQKFIIKKNVYINFCQFFFNDCWDTLRISSGVNFLTADFPRFPRLTF